jgi:hypothetical protein
VNARKATGILILVAMVVLGAAMLPPYIENFSVQQWLEDYTHNPANAQRPADLIKVDLIEGASRKGIAVQPGEIRIRQSGGQLGIEMRYVVPVDLVVYQVSLHFRPKAGVL